MSKAVGGAVVRNLVRRRLRHLVRERLTALPAGRDAGGPGAAGRGRPVVRANWATDLDGAIAAARGRPRERARPTVDDRSDDAAATLGARVLSLPIVAYRRWISPALPARCRFYPSCSAYALEAVATHGALRGTGLAIWRLLRCHPFHPGGYDPVPPARRRAAPT